MDKEMYTFFHDAFCNRLRAVKSEMEAHGGTFKDCSMVKDVSHCIRGIKNLHKIKAMADATASTATVV